MGILEVKKIQTELNETMPPHLNQTYRPGDQVMINYGPHNNITLYSEYGFLLSDNADDHLPLHLKDLVDVAAQFLGKQVLAFQTQVCSFLSGFVEKEAWLSLRKFHIH